MAVWSVVVSWAYRSYARRTTGWVVADLAVALVALALTAAVKDPGYTSTLPGYWVMAAMLAWAIHWRALGGLAAAVLLSVDDFADPALRVGERVRQRLPSPGRWTHRRPDGRLAAALGDPHGSGRTCRGGGGRTRPPGPRRPRRRPAGARPGAAPRPRPRAGRGRARTPRRRAGARAPGTDPPAGRGDPGARRRRPGRRAVGARAPWWRLRRGPLGRRTPGPGGRRRDRGRGLGLSRQRGGARRTLGARMGAPGGDARRDRGHGPRRGPGHPCRDAWRRPRLPAGWASPRRCVAGSPSWAVRRR